MKTNKTVVETKAATATKTVKPGMVKFNRFLANAFRLLIFKKMKKATVAEVGFDSIFSRIEAEKKKVLDKIDEQKKLIEAREKDVEKEINAKDESIKNLEAKIKELREKQESFKKENKDENEKILAEQKRGLQIVENMNKFYGLDS